MYKKSFYRFILYVLLKEGKSNFFFKLEAILLGKQYASKHYFFKLFRGCDVPSFLYVKKLFEKEVFHDFLDVKECDVEIDEKGLMTGRINNDCKKV